MQDLSKVSWLGLPNQGAVKEGWGAFGHRDDALADLAQDTAEMPETPEEVAGEGSVE